MGTLEIASLIGGAASGFIFRMMATQMANKQELFKMMLQKIAASDASADQASKRVPIDIGRGIRRFLVVSVLFSLVFAPFILSLLNMNTVVEIVTPKTSWLFGLFETGGQTKYVGLSGYLIPIEMRCLLISILSFYFGSAAASNKS